MHLAHRTNTVLNFGVTLLRKVIGQVLRVLKSGNDESVSLWNKASLNGD